GQGPGLPVGQIDRIAQIILTGGAAQVLDEARVQRLLAPLLPASGAPPLVQIDRRYELWVAGITWADQAPS
ncbi:MAG TPA: hypothetical protein VMV45_05650, partial [Casimicrobiaceae bacterium]|nr:hypothetical protein [Casimicrobiaceae bacterium]